jgi:uncharacterized protein YcnI
VQTNTPVKVGAALGAAALIAVGAPLAASAHVTVDPSSTAASGFSVLTFAVSHGCDGSPTTGLTFTVPDGIASIAPTVNPGWTIEQSEGQVVYTAHTPLPDGQRTTFELSVKLPDLPAGEQVDFPVLQQCEAGSTDWADVAVAGEAEPEHPAPSIVLTESAGDGHGHAAVAVADESASGHQATTNPDDIVARILGIGGLALGAIGLTVAVMSRRKEAIK